MERFQWRRLADLYVVNDSAQEPVIANNGNGTFTDIAGPASVEDAGAGMGVSWLDYDTTGQTGYLRCDMWTAAGERIASQGKFSERNAPKAVRALYRKHAMGNSLFRKLGCRQFSRCNNCNWCGNGAVGVVQRRVGFWIMTGSSTSMLRTDWYPVHRATISIVFSGGKWFSKSPQEAKPSHDYEQGWECDQRVDRADGTWSGFERNVFYANNRDGTFSDVFRAVGLDFLEDGRRLCPADFDHDGGRKFF